MGICEELMNIEKDFEVEYFSQSDWEDALIDTWRKDGTISGAVARASKTPEGMVITAKRWGALFSQAGKLKPSLGEFTSGRNRVRVWIAKNATTANDKLWEGDYEAAKALLKKGGKRVGGRTKNKNEAIKAERKHMKGLLVIRTRARDKRSDWGTCK